MYSVGPMPSRLLIIPIVCVAAFNVDSRVAYGGDAGAGDIGAGAAACGSNCQRAQHGQMGCGSTGCPAPLYYETTLPTVLNTRAEYLTYIEEEYGFGVVADLDLMSRDPQEFIWRSYLKKGRVVRVSKRDERDRFTIEWDNELELKSSTATRNRSMELSELVHYDRSFIAFCDYSGIAYKIDFHTGKVFQRWAIADGNGDEPKPFKAEWATLKDDRIWLGSIGFEWYGPDGKVLHRNPEWIKTIDSKGLIQNLNWHPVYQTIRTATNTTAPGFMWHEAVEWEPVERVWIMLPRFASTTARYEPGTEHESTADLLIVADSDFRNIRVTRLQHHEPGFGFTSVRRLPGSRKLFMVLRVHEDGSNQRTQAGIIDLDGNFYMDPPYVEVGARKFEGLAFI
eukprot:TRINITY_DN82557_c0_g1_i1.p1 TRINITY_DN82557_c0_g1~~TRINITY_DN82557_c0_g1_i1.p1  ORF type:complete len:407 (-),score=38.06 TRINITY_DN82557_c0_g1_i1:189-1376(-)